MVGAWPDPAEDRLGIGARYGDRTGGHHWRTPAERYVTLTIDWATVPLVAVPLPPAAGLTTR